MSVNERKKIWLTGSRGFIGSHLVKELTDIYDITSLSNTKTDNNETYDENIRPKYINFKNENEIIEIIKKIGLPDIFIHIGWGAMTDPHSYVHLQDNVVQSKMLIKVLFEHGLSKFIFLGSMNEYGDRTGSLYEEMEPVGELTNYAKGKIEVAKFGFKKAKEMDKKFIHIRLFYTYGPIKKKNTLIHDILDGYKNKTDIDLSPCEQYRDYIHVSDAVKGIKLMCEFDESTTVNLGSGESIQLKEFILIFWKILGGNRERLHFGKKPKRKEQPQPNCFANLEKLERITKWKPSIQINDGIKMTIEEFKKNSQI